MGRQNRGPWTGVSTLANSPVEGGAPIDLISFQGPDEHTHSHSAVPNNGVKLGINFIIFALSTLSKLWVSF